MTISGPPPEEEAEVLELEAAEDEKQQTATKADYAPLPRDRRRGFALCLCGGYSFHPLFAGVRPPTQPEPAPAVPQIRNVESARVSGDPSWRLAIGLFRGAVPR